MGGTVYHCRRVADLHSRLEESGKNVCMSKCNKGWGGVGAVHIGLLIFTADWRSSWTVFAVSKCSNGWAGMVETTLHNYTYLKQMGFCSTGLTIHIACQIDCAFTFLSFNYVLICSG